MRKTIVAVLMGGRSAEREISLVTGSVILRSLDPEKYTAFAVDTARFHVDAAALDAQESLPPACASSSGTLAEMVPLSSIVHSNGDDVPRPDVAFIALHGKYGEDGTVQGLLELLGVPYVGCGVLSSALAMDKIMARKVMAGEGVPVPKGITVDRDMPAEDLVAEVERELGLPVVVKPNKQGSTIGLSIARDASNLASAVDLAFQHDDEVLIEEFVEGVEITVPVIGNGAGLRTLPIVEIVPEGGFYDYHAKYTPGATEEIVPARVPEDIYREAEQLALTCHRALGCRDMSRTDMIVRDGDIRVLEVNTIPGMTPTSLLPTAAKAAGIQFSELLDMLIGFALNRG